MSENERNTWPIVIVVISVVAIGFVAIVSAFGSGTTSYGMMGGGMMGFGWLFMLIPLLFFIAFVIILTGALSDGTHHDHCCVPSNVHQSAPSIEILNQRYAKGEITRDEYARMKNEIGYG